MDPSYVKGQLDKLDISLTTLRDAIRGTGNKTLTDLDTDITSFSGKFPPAATLGDTLGNPTTTIIGAASLGFDGTYWRRIAADTAGRMKVQLDSIPNPPNLDVSLSSFRDRFAPAVALGDALGNPTTTIIGGALLGWDSAGAVWERVYTDGSNRLKVQLDSIPNPPNLNVGLDTRLSEATFTARVPTLNVLSQDVGGASYNALVVIPSLGGDISRMPYMVENISVSTTEGSTAIAAPGGKIVKITNKGDVDVLIGVNASVPLSNPVKIRARTVRVLLFKGATSIAYKTATGTSTIDLEWWN